MNLFNLLCVSDKPDVGALGIIVMILPILVGILLSYGIISICENLAERKTSDKANKKYKSGVYYVILSFIMLVFSYIIIIVGGNNFHDSCRNLSPALSVFHSNLRIIQIFVPLILLIKGLITGLTKNKKELKKKIVMYISLAILIFFAFTLCDAILGLITQSGNDGNWAQCWCGD